MYSERKDENNNFQELFEHIEKLLDYEVKNIERGNLGIGYFEKLRYTLAY